MNKLELAKIVASKTGLTQKAALEATSSVFETIKEVMKTDPVHITGFGSFSVVDRAERIARNPSTGEKLQLKPYKSVKYKPSKALRKITD